MNSDTSNRQPPAPGVFPGGCVVLVPATIEAPQLLVRALGSKELRTQVVRDEPGVMEALGSMGGGRRVLIVVEPEYWERLGELIDAVQAYHAGVLCWQYAEPDGSPGRLGMLEKPEAMQPANGRLNEGNEPDTAPIGQISGHRRRPIDQLLVKVPGRALSSREVVTRQELTMLLGPPPGEVG